MEALARFQGPIGPDGSSTVSAENGAYQAAKAK
eukprot:CAMPEP_0170409966 /NCGR_PEP_ID=MMETSP0117_2-20130122/29627_1 /TAXON_ID=400756 /ORGANISM="Durinskia baltica, Strain CSIRO CS-38" /LENGTH=32 /DNA_ID= /DNA_START= /DNA_END= /DNA_ORIENTATION=